MKKTKKRSARERRILILALLVAGAIVAGSTFAWFSSSDEVTNRLSARADYDVSIAEDFTPPENWLPGQTVDKNVAFVNTGNVDAFVRSWLEGVMRVLKEDSTVLKWNVTDNQIKDNDTTVLQASSAYNTTDKSIGSLGVVTEQDMLDLGFTHSYTTSSTPSTVYYLKALNSKFVTNPATQGNSNPDAFNEIISVQAGGNLVYVPVGNSTFKFKTPNQAISVTNSAGAIVTLEPNTEYQVTITNSNDSNVPNITATYTAGTAPNPNTGTITVKTLADLPNGAIDSDTFVPITTGLYVFKRNEAITSAEHTTNDNPEFSGYYYVAVTSDAGGEGVYFALHNNQEGRSDYTLPSNAYSYTEVGATKQFAFAPSAELALYTAKRTLVTDNDLTWSLSDSTLTATYNGGTTGAGTGYDDIIIDVTLANLDSGAEKWTTKSASVGDPAKTKYTFYYNNDLEEGATTARLVDAVTLNSAVTEKAFIAFDFDLNVFMDSVQVTLDANGNETDTSVANWTATMANNGVNSNVGSAVGAKGARDDGTAEIALMTWSD